MTFMMRPSVSSPTGTEIGRARIGHCGAADEAFGRVHGDGAHGVLAEMLRHFEHQAVAVVDGLQRVQDGRQVAVERDVHHGADDLADLAGHGRSRPSRLRPSWLLPSPFRTVVLLERFRARNDFDEFFGDLRLALAVVDERQLA